jgi:uncharacterized membrane protein
VSERLLTLERIIEVALTVGVLVSAALLFAGLALGAPAALRWGIVLLLFTPVARVVVVTIGLLSHKDWLFGFISLFVLAVLFSGMFVGGKL